jgi:hypothetical protein
MGQQHRHIILARSNQARSKEYDDIPGNVQQVHTYIVYSLCMLPNLFSATTICSQNPLFGGLPLRNFAPMTLSIGTMSNRCKCYNLPKLAFNPTNPAVCHLMRMAGQCKAPGHLRPDRGPRGRGHVQVLIRGPL